MNLIQAWSNMFSQFAQFSGRAGQAEYWWVALPYGLLSLVLFQLNVVLWVAVYLVMLVPTVALVTRRLHDTDRSGWWQLVSLIPFVGFVVLVVFLCLEGTKGDNRFGPMPQYLVKAVAPQSPAQQGSAEV